MIKILTLLARAWSLYDTLQQRAADKAKAKKQEEADRVQAVADEIRRVENTQAQEKKLIDSDGVFRMAPGRVMGGLYYPKHFTTLEFNQTAMGGENWWPHMEPVLIAILDTLRESWGGPITISPVIGALGRRQGDTTKSDHNIDVTGKVRAADVFIAHPDKSPVNDRETAERLVDLAIQCGANAIGVYPHWRNAKGEVQCGFHIGWRPDLVGADYIATWGMVRTTMTGPQHTVSMIDALAQIGRIPN